MESFTARIAERMEHAQQRAQHLRAAVPELARELLARGATRVVLVGSLARGDRFNVDTDVDLVVWGMEMGDAYDAACTLGARVNARVEVIPFDLCGPRLLRAIDTEGIDVTERDDAA